MPDLSVLIIDQPSAHTISDPRQNAFRYRQGDFLRAFDSSQVATIVGIDYIYDDIITSKFQIIHVIGVPVSLTFDNLSDFENFPNPGSNPIDLVENPFIKRRRTKFGFNKGLMPLAQRNQLNADKEITLSWTEFKSFTQRKIVIDIDDASTDTFTPLVDGDL